MQMRIGSTKPYGKRICRMGNTQPSLIRCFFSTCFCAIQQWAVIGSVEPGIIFAPGSLDEQDMDLALNNITAQ